MHDGTAANRMKREDGRSQREWNNYAMKRRERREKREAIEQ
jgi:hypothetical protein